MENVIKARNITLYFTIMSALFIALTPQFMGFILPILFIVPIFMGLNGIKHRKRSGFYLGLGVVPLTWTVSVTWMKYFISISGNLSSEFTRISNQYHINPQIAQFITLFFFLLSLVMFCLSLVVFVKLLKNKNIFK